MLTDQSFPLGGDSLTHRRVNCTNNKNWTAYFCSASHGDAPGDALEERCESEAYHLKNGTYAGFPTTPTGCVLC